MNKINLQGLSLSGSIKDPSSKEEEADRQKNLNSFLETGLPNKKDENWKFTDLNLIIKKNFKKINNNFDFKANSKLVVLDFLIRKGILFEKQERYINQFFSEINRRF